GSGQAELDAYAERFVQTIQNECLDSFIVLGEKHLNYLVQEFVEHYNTERPHMVIGRVPARQG
ncbi:MAG: transposase, partial [Rhodospirillales bacterium]|nr:transposase [Rhodospirillales bacterium]